MSLSDPHLRATNDDRRTTDRPNSLTSLDRSPDHEPVSPEHEPDAPAREPIRLCDEHGRLCSDLVRPRSDLDSLGDGHFSATCLYLSFECDLPSPRCEHLSASGSSIRGSRMKSSGCAPSMRSCCIAGLFYPSRSSGAPATRSRTRCPRTIRLRSAPAIVAMTVPVSTRHVALALGVGHRACATSAYPRTHTESRKGARAATYGGARGA